MAKVKAKELKVVIIGGAAQSKHFDFDVADQPEVEIWGINAIRFSWVPRWSRMFNVHRLQLLKNYGWPIESEAQWAATNRDIPFYVADPWPDGWLPCQRIFPRAALAKYPRGNYHVNTFDWLTAFAIHEGATSIQFHGIQLALNAVAEQLSSRACLEYWCGYAEGLGIKTIFAKDCDLFHAYHLVKSDRVYGYDDCPVFEDRTKDAPKGAPYRYDGR